MEDQDNQKKKKKNRKSKKHIEEEEEENKVEGNTDKSQQSLLKSENCICIFCKQRIRQNDLPSNFKRTNACANCQRDDEKRHKKDKKQKRAKKHKYSDEDEGCSRAINASHKLSESEDDES